jgi:hypothetical protein
LELDTVAVRERNVTVGEAEPLGDALEEGECVELPECVRLDRPEAEPVVGALNVTPSALVPLAVPVNEKPTALVPVGLLAPLFEVVLVLALLREAVPTFDCDAVPDGVGVRLRKVAHQCIHASSHCAYF